MSTAAQHLKAAAACLLTPTLARLEECRLELETAMARVRHLAPADRAALRPLLRRASRLLQNAAALQFGEWACVYDNRGALTLPLSSGRLHLEG